MCYYDQIVYTCGCWRWSRFRAQCNREHRRGETCGMKLPMDKDYSEDKCKLCEKYEIKGRRHQNSSEKLARMQRNKEHRATQEMLREEIMDLTKEMHKIYAEIIRKREDVGTRGSRPDTRVIRA